MCNFFGISAIGLPFHSFTVAECVKCGLDGSVVWALYEGRTPLQLKEAGISCLQARQGGLLPNECHQAGYTYEDGVAAGFTRGSADWMTNSLGSPYNKW